MDEGVESPGPGLRAFAAALIVIGIASVLSNGAAVALSRDVSRIQTTIAICYGIAAVVAGILVWRRESGAGRAYLAWCTTIVFYLMTIPKLFVWYSAPFFLVAILLLSWGYRYIARNVGPEVSGKARRRQLRAEE